ncbi:MAG: hypothetical protein GJ671_09505 [Alteromonadaceae bacterium]|nr:hypothetical protein [Alteromonadaceae bacterium]
MNRVTTTVTFDVSEFNYCENRTTSIPLEEMLEEALHNLMWQFKERTEGALTAKFLKILEYEYKASIEFTLELTKSITQNELHQILEESYLCLDYSTYCDCEDGNCGDCIDGGLYVSAQEYEFKSELLEERISN